MLKCQHIIVDKEANIHHWRSWKKVFFRKSFDIVLIEINGKGFFFSVSNIYKMNYYWYLKMLHCDNKRDALEKNQLQHSLYPGANPWHNGHRSHLCNNLLGLEQRKRWDLKQGRKYDHSPECCSNISLTALDLEPLLISACFARIKGKKCNNSFKTCPNF